MFLHRSSTALTALLLGACCATQPTPQTPIAAEPVAEQRVADRHPPGLYVPAPPAPEPVPEPTPEPLDTGKPCPPSPCGDDCSNQPFIPTRCWTTEYGPAKADIFLAKSNFLYCDGGTYALCFFSGPPDKTGKPGDKPFNNALPCTLQGDGVANCTCQVYTGGAYFVDINSILNLYAWYETVAACGADGSGCKNIEACGDKPTAGSCPGLHFAPVCKYIREQDPENASVSLIPGADVISAFSLAMNDDYQVGTSKCPSGEYAGCMTAPCYFQEGATIPPNNGDLIQCMCPTWTGDFQIGQFRQASDCTIDGGGVYVWSAANKVGSD